MSSEQRRPVRAFPRIQYFGGELTMPGRHPDGWSKDYDNPMADGFVPLENRDERDKSRWWALRNRRRKTGGDEFAVMDDPLDTGW